MLVYIIDAYNLAHRVKPVKDAANPRQALIDYIRAHKLTGSKNNKVIMVFDGYPQNDAAGADFEVVFSYDKTADEVIKKRLSTFVQRSEVVVVSDDREIRDYAKTAHAVSMRLHDFLGRTKTTVVKKTDGKEISSAVADEITTQMRKIWLNE